MNLDRNDIKMSTLSTEYYYNGKNVTCELMATINAPYEFDVIFENEIFTVKVKATAKCHDDDVYNKTCGKKIALAKAESKAYRILANMINRKWAALMDAIETLYPCKEGFVAKAEKSIAHNNEYIKELPSKYNVMG